MNDRPVFAIAIAGKRQPIDLDALGIGRHGLLNETFTFEFQYKGKTVLRMQSARVDLIRPGFAMLNEMLARANASIESEPEDQRP